MILNLFTPKYNTQPTFTARLPKGNFSDIRHIPGITCAKCGHRMTSIPEQNNIINKMTEYAKKVLQRTEFDSYRGLPAFQFILDIVEKHPRTPLTTIIENKQNKEKIAQLDIPAQEMIEEMTTISKNFFQKSPQVIKVLYKYRDEMPDEYKDLLDYMKVYSLLYPKNTFSEIFQKPEVIEHHKQKEEEIYKQFSKEYNKAFNKLDKTVEKLPPNIQNKFLRLNKKAKSISAILAFPEITKRIMINSIYIKSLNTIQDKKLIELIKKQIDNLPVRTLTAHGHIMTLSNKSDKDIIKTILNNITSTFEHIIPVSSNGPNSLSNGIHMCQKCNKERANIIYPIFMKYFPDFAQNIQKQINQIMILIKNGRLNKYSYPPKVKKRIENATYNKINIDIKKYMKFLQTREKELLPIKEQQENFVYENRKRINKTYYEIKQINTRIDDLLKNLKSLKRQKAYLEKNIKDESSELKDSKTYLQQLNDEYNAIHTALIEKNEHNNKH